MQIKLKSEWSGATRTVWEEPGPRECKHERGEHNVKERKRESKSE
jgi:hypothetical protein